MLLLLTVVQLACLASRSLAGTSLCAAPVCSSIILEQLLCLCACLPACSFCCLLPVCLYRGWLVLLFSFIISCHVFHHSNVGSHSPVWEQLHHWINQALRRHRTAATLLPGHINLAMHTVPTIHVNTEPQEGIYTLYTYLFQAAMLLQVGALGWIS